jgi:SAM-dependent methyltransferase
MEPTRIGRHYQGELGHTYFGWQDEQAKVGARIDLFKFEEHVGPSDTVVDFGCGGGHLLELLPGAERIGVEPNAAAREAAERRGLRVAASTGELGDSSADVVISNHALEHAVAPFHELRELHRVLRRGGRLVLWLPIDDWRRQREPRADEPNHHLYTWTPQLIANLLDEAGFEVRECRVVAHAWPRHYELLFRRLPRPAFDLLARAWARLALRRQVMALAVRR